MRTEVVGKLGAAVTAVLHAALMAIDIVQLLLLPAAEAAVVLFHLFFGHNSQCQLLGQELAHLL